MPQNYKDSFSEIAIFRQKVLGGHQNIAGIVFSEIAIFRQKFLGDSPKYSKIFYFPSHLWPSLANSSYKWFGQCGYIKKLKKKMLE